MLSIWKFSKKKLNSYQIITIFGSYEILTPVNFLVTFDFSILNTKLPYDKHTKLPYDNLKSKLSSIVDFDFKGGDKTFNRLCNNGAAYWGKKTKGGIAFSKTSLKTAITHLIENCHCQ